MNLSNTGHDDSSSEEAQTNHHPIGNGKPAVPPRPRSISATRGVITTNLINSKQLKPVNGNAFTDDLPCRDNDVANADCKSSPLFPEPLKLGKLIDHSFVYYSELPTNIEYHITVDGHNQFRYAIAPKTQEY